jgi:hypothetical protein
MHVAPPDCRDTPTYWFAILEMARKRGDAETATQAERELARLGVDVTFRNQRGASSV